MTRVLSSMAQPLKFFFGNKKIAATEEDPNFASSNHAHDPRSTSTSSFASQSNNAPYSSLESAPMHKSDTRQNAGIGRGPYPGSRTSAQSRFVADFFNSRQPASSDRQSSLSPRAAHGSGNSRSNRPTQQNFVDSLWSEVEPAHDSTLDRIPALPPMTGAVEPTAQV